MRPTRVLALAAGGIAGGYVGLVTGRLTLDLGLGRRTRPLGPIVVDIDAPPDVVFDVTAAPYAERRPQAMREKVQILERTDHMVLAAHRTPVAWGLTAVTVEIVTFDPPTAMGFRLMRGPVPHVSEVFAFAEHGGGTRMTYTGELGTDLWGLGAAWGDVVAGPWEATVRSSMADVATESERRAR